MSNVPTKEQAHAFFIQNVQRPALLEKLSSYYGLNIRTEAEAVQLIEIAERRLADYHAAQEKTAGTNPFLEAALYNLVPAQPSATAVAQSTKTAATQYGKNAYVMAAAAQLVSE